MALNSCTMASLPVAGICWKNSSVIWSSPGAEFFFSCLIAKFSSSWANSLLCSDISVTGASFANRYAWFSSMSQRSVRKHLSRSRSNSIQSVLVDSLGTVVQVDSVGSRSSVVQFHPVDSSVSVGSVSLSQLSSATLRRQSQNAAAWTVKRNSWCRRLYTPLCRHSFCVEGAYIAMYLKFSNSFGWRKVSTH